MPLLPFGNPIGFVPASRGGVYIEPIGYSGRILAKGLLVVAPTITTCYSKVILLGVMAVNFLVFLRTRSCQAKDPSNNCLADVNRPFLSRKQPRENLAALRYAVYWKFQSGGFNSTSSNGIGSIFCKTLSLSLVTTTQLSHFLLS